MFWQDFWPNFISDLLAGGIIGSLFAWFVGVRLSRLERSEHQKEVELNEKRRAIQYLELIQKEIEVLMEKLPTELKNFSETGWGREIRIETPFWDTVDKSGDLPRLVDPSLLQSLTEFYGYLTFARRGRDFLIQTWLIPNPKSVPGMEAKQSAFIQITKYGLNGAINVAPDIVELLTSNIDALKRQMEQLNA